MSFLRVKLVAGSTVEFSGKPIGSGGEKVAFPTKDRGHVVCFFANELNDRFERRRRIEKILNTYNPTVGANGEFWRSHFCWPVGLVDGNDSLPQSFLTANRIVEPALAVVAPMYRANFFFKDNRGAVHEKNGKWFTSEKCRQLLPLEEKGNLLGYLKVCTKMARAVRRMHFAGLAHSDLSNKNVLIDPRNGDACIIDIDSLVVPNVAPPTVYGTPGYIAPEVISGHSLPSIATDCHALAVLMYETLLLRHPLIGPKVNCISSAEEDDKLSMGAKALFVEHPTDHSNALKPAPSIPVGRLGPYLRELFRRAFVEGLHHPHLRPGAADWEKALYKTFDLLHPSPVGNGWFVLAPDMPPQCPYTKQKISAAIPFAYLYSEMRPGNFVYDKHSLTIYHNFPLMSWHINSNVSPTDNSDRKRRGYFSFHNGRWYLVNESDSTMQVLNGPSISRGNSVEVQDGLQLRTTVEPNGRILSFRFNR